MTTPRKLAFKNPAAAHGHGLRTTSGRKVTIPPEKRHASPKGAPIAPPHTKKKKSSGKGIVIGVFAAVLALAGLFGIYKYAEMKRIEARIEAFALAGFRAACDEQYARIAPLLSQAVQLQEQAAALVSEAEAAVQFVTLSPLKREPKPEAAPPTPDGAPADGSPKKATKAAPAQAPRRAPPPEPSREVGHETVGGRDAPEGIMSLAELRAQRERKSKPTQDQTAAAPESVAAPEVVPAAAPPPTRARKPRIVVIGQQMLEWQDTISTKIEGMHASEVEADSVRVLASRDPLSTQAAERVKKIEKIVNDIEGQQGTITAMVAEMRKGMVEVVTIRDETDKQRKAAAAEALRLRLEREHKELVVREKARAVELHDSVVEMLKKYAFAEALAELEVAKQKLETQEGKADLQVYIDRCARLRDMKTDLIQRLNEQPYRWGWGLGTVTKDVLGADDNLVSVLGEKHNWADVPLDQMKKFLDHYAKNDVEKVSWRATMAFGTAILMHECGRTADADVYSKEAARLGAFLRDDIERLLPDYR